MVFNDSNCLNVEANSLKMVVQFIYFHCLILLNKSLEICTLNRNPVHYASFSFSLVIHLQFYFIVQVLCIYILHWCICFMFLV